MHALAPGSLPVLVTEPAAHPSHEAWPVDGWKKPEAHSEQAAIADTAENLPAVHSLHALAPGSVPLLVIEPGTHTTHEAAFDSVAYSPTVHIVQVVPPTKVPVSVIEPTWHGKQNDLPS